MAVQIAINVDEIAIRYRQPYVSEALNRKALSEPGGIQKGFRLIPNSAAPNQITLAVDEQAGVSAMNITNEANPEFSVAWIRADDLNVPVPTAAGWHHLFVNHGYVFNADTEPTLTWYSSAEIADPAVANDGIYIGSAEGAPAGSNVTNVSTTATISNGSALKRATSATSAGARTRVRGDNAEPVLYVDFNGRSMSPVDLDSDKTNVLTAAVMTQTQLNSASSASPTNIIANFGPETRDHALVFWRRSSDVDNRGDAGAQSSAFAKRYALPCHVPVLNDSDLTHKMRVFVRYKALRQTAGLRSTEPNNLWTVGLNYSAARVNSNALNTSTVLTQTVLTLPANGALISDERLVLGNTAGEYRWATLEFEVPKVDAAGQQVRISAASLFINVPDMFEDEALSIDRLLVESDVPAALSAVDGSQGLTSSSAGRVSAIGAEAFTADSALMPFARGIALVRGGDIPMAQDTSRVCYGIELADHNVMVGLPVRDNSTPGMIENSDADFSIVASDNINEIYAHLHNVFRQSNLVVNAPGMYETLPLITRLENNGSTVPSALRAPQRAGITVNSGNLVVRKALGRINPDLTTTGNDPSHETGVVVADSVYVTNSVRYGTLDERGAYAESWSPTLTVGLEASHVKSNLGVSIAGVYQTAGGLEPEWNPHPIINLVGLTFTGNNTWLFQADQAGYINTLDSFTETYDRKISKLSLIVADSSQEEFCLSLTTPPTQTAVKDAPLLGFRETLRSEEIGSISLTDHRPVSRNNKTGIFDLGSQDYNKEMFIDLGDNLLQGGTGFTIIDNPPVPGSWSGEPMLMVGLPLTKDAGWSVGLLDSSDYPIRGQFIRASEFTSQSLLSIVMNTYSTQGYLPNASEMRGVSTYVTQGLTIDPFSTRRKRDDLLIDVAGATLRLKLSHVVIESEPPESVDADHPNASLAQGMLHYLAPIHEDGTAYAINELANPLPAGTKLRYQAYEEIYRDPTALPALLTGRQFALNYRPPVWRFEHLIHRDWDSDMGTMAVGHRNISVFALLAAQAGLLDSNGDLAADANQKYAAILSIGGIRDILLEGVFDDLDYGSGLTLAQKGAELGLDLSLATGNQRHEFSVNIMYDASFATNNYVLHPMVLSPRLMSASFPYKEKSL